MKKLALILIFLLSVSYSKPSEKDLKSEPLSQEARQSFIIKETLILEFKGKRYKIFKALSKNFSPTKEAKAFYLLDANKHFVLLLNGLAKQNFKSPFIIIGIGYDTNEGYDIAQRTRDYTPKVLGKGYERGGGEGEFFAFLDTRLLPSLKKSYPKIHKQALFGHSFGGLFALNALINHKLIFDSYFIASPSLWWGNGEFLKKLNTSNCPHILILKGEKEKNRANSMTVSALIENFLNKCRVDFKEFKDQTHGAVILPALIFAFKEFVR